MRNVAIALLLGLISPSTSWACFQDYPGIQTEQIRPLGIIAWSPLMPTHELTEWLERSGFQSLRIHDETSQRDVFWLKGACLAQVIEHDDGMHGWLIGSEHMSPWLNILEAPNATNA